MILPYTNNPLQRIYALVRVFFFNTLVNHPNKGHHYYNLKECTDYAENIQE